MRYNPNASRKFRAKRIRSKRKKARLILPLVMALLALFGCSSKAPNQTDGDTVTATAQAVTVDYSGVLAYVIGSYTSCTGHTNGSLWSLALNGGTSLPDPTLTVTKGNTSCILSVTGFIDGSAVTFNDDGPPIVLATTYSGASAEAFTAAGTDAGASKFYANCDASSLAFTSNFAVTCVYSASDNGLSQSVGPTSSVATATASASTVPAPSATFVTSGLLDTDDASGKLLSVSGSLSITGGGTCNEYAVVAGALPATWGQIDAAFNAAAQSACSATITIPITSLPGLTIGVQLPVSMTVILANSVDGVTSYQTDTLTFAQ